MTSLRWAAVALTGATVSLACVALLPVVGYTTTAGLWLTYATIAGGLITMATTVAAMVALTPVQPPTGPQEAPEPLVRVSVVRDALPAATRPVRGAIELPAGSVS